MPSRIFGKKRVDRAIEIIQNCHQTLIDRIHQEVDYGFTDKCEISSIVKYLNDNFLNLEKPVNRCTTEYWTKRGWPENLARKNSKENASNMLKGKMSPFSLEFWLAKGFTEAEADFQRNKIRPIRKEYWMERGFSEEESITLAKNKKEKNDKSGGRKQAERTDIEKRESSPRCKEYWMLQGHTEQESIEKVSSVQAVFSLDTCLEKYGPIDGPKIWKKRQEKWIDTMQSKSDIEKSIINEKKSPINLKAFDGDVQKCIKTLEETRSMKLFSTMESFMEDIKLYIKENPFTVYWPLEKFMNEIPKIQREILGESLVRENIEPLLKPNDLHFVDKGRLQAYRKYVKDGLLRSSFEIYFYEKFTSLFPNRKIKIDKCYPGSNFRYDFMIDDNICIEICPLYYRIEKYRIKMDKKQKVFGCILLKSIDEIDDFLERLL